MTQQFTRPSIRPALAAFFFMRAAKRDDTGGRAPEAALGVAPAALRAHCYFHFLEEEVMNG